MARTFWVETLGCPKNQVDSDKITGSMLGDGLRPAESAQEADVVVVNTCAFVEEAREESISTILGLDDLRAEGSELVVTGCMAARYGQELAAALPEVDRVVGFGAQITSTNAATGVPVSIGPKAKGRAGASRQGGAGDMPSGLASDVPAMDLLNMVRPPSASPWAYVKVAEGCDKRCGFCAIPSFRGPQRSRSIESILEEIDGLGPKEVVLIAQDLAAYGRDQGVGEKSIVSLYEEVALRVPWVRLLYLYPSELSDALIEAIASSSVPYFDLSLQHVSGSLLRRMRRWGNGERYMSRIERIRTLRPDAAFRSNFIVGYPGETEEDHDQLLAFVEAAQLDWCGFFAYSSEDGTYAAGLDHQVDTALVADRLAELREMQDGITASRRDQLIGQTVRVLVDEPGQARSHREAPEIDGVIEVDPDLTVGWFHDVVITDARGPDLSAL